jgi:hypothetical protein
MSYHNQITKTTQLIAECKSDLSLAEGKSDHEKVVKLRDKLRNLEYDLRMYNRKQWEEDTQRVGYGDE